MNKFLMLHKELLPRLWQRPKYKQRQGDAQCTLFQFILPVYSYRNIDSTYWVKPVNCEAVLQLRCYC